MDSRLGEQSFRLVAAGGYCLQFAVRQHSFNGRPALSLMSHRPWCLHSRCVTSGRVLTDRRKGSDGPAVLQVSGLIRRMFTGR